MLGQHVFYLCLSVDYFELAYGHPQQTVVFFYFTDSAIISGTVFEQTQFAMRILRRIFEEQKSVSKDDDSPSKKKNFQSFLLKLCCKKQLFIFQFLQNKAIIFVYNQRLSMFTTLLNANTSLSMADSITFTVYFKKKTLLKVFVKAKILLNHQW